MHIIMALHVIKKYCALTSVINSENQKNYVDKMIIIIMHVIMIQSSDIY